MSLNLPDVQVSDIRVTEKDIVIATHGRSIYVLDDISPVRTKDQGIQAGVHLFKPYYAVRNVQKAVFQYYLDKDANDLKIEILNKEGVAIQTFIGAVPKEKKDSAIVEEDEDDRKPVAPVIKPGLNKFEWDLKYPGASYFKGMIFWGAPVYTGPMAVPGKYQVRMTSGGKSVTEPFDIKLDPRATDINMVDVEEKFKLSIQIRDEVSKANDAVIHIRAIKEKLKIELATSKPKRTNEIKILMDKLSSIEENLYQVKNQSSQDPLNYPIKLDNKLAALMRVVESGDYKPTAGSYKVFEELKVELAIQLNDLDKTLTTNKAKK